MQRAAVSFTRFVHQDRASIISGNPPEAFSVTLSEFLACALVKSCCNCDGSDGMHAEKQARRFFVSGRVQGVGYRYFAMDTAEQMGIAGYTKNLADGRVEVYAIGTSAQLRGFARELERGPTFAAVADVSEVEAEILSAFSSGFSVNYDR
jgi:acylphosphatase